MPQGKQTRSDLMSEELPEKKRKTPSYLLSSSPRDETTLNCLDRISRSDQTALPPILDRKTRLQYMHNSLVAMAVDLMERRFYYSSEGEWKKGNHPQAIAIRRGKCLFEKFIYKQGRWCWCELEQLEREPKGEEERMYWWNVKGLEYREKSLITSRLDLDCLAHCSAASGVLGGKIYVFGGCEDPDSLNWAEVFDPNYIHDSVASEEGYWNHVQVRRSDWCLIDKIINCIDQHWRFSSCELKQQLEPPHKKMKTPSSSSSLSPSLSSLPEDLTLNCLARVSRSDQVALSGVSKTYRFLIASPELYKMRSILRCTENCLYVCLLTPRNPNPCWFILLRRGNHRFLRPIPGDRLQAPEGSAVVTLDSGIYVIGGMIKGQPTSHVLFLDCRTHTWRWHPVPSMRAARSSAAAGVVGGKIYVFGGCEDPDSSNWGEVFDPKTQTWDSLIPMPDRKTRCQYINNSFVVKNEKVYAVDLMERSFYYSPSEGEWQKGNHAQAIAIRRDKCLIDKTIYCIDQLGRLYWCELEQLEREPKGEEEGMYWRNVKGLESLEKSLSSSRLVHFDGMLEALWETRKIGFGNDKKLIDLLPGARLSNSGSNIVLFWDVLVEEEDRRRLEIWCAEISLERRCQGGTTEIWGNVEWSNAVMTVDPFLHHYKVLHSVSINI